MDAERKQMTNYSQLTRELNPQTSQPLHPYPLPCIGIVATSRHFKFVYFASKHSSHHTWIIWTVALWLSKSRAQQKARLCIYLLGTVKKEFWDDFTGFAKLRKLQQKIPLLRSGKRLGFLVWKTYSKLGPFSPFGNLTLWPQGTNLTD